MGYYDIPLIYVKHALQVDAEPHGEVLEVLGGQPYVQGRQPVAGPEGRCRVEGDSNYTERRFTAVPAKPTEGIRGSCYEYLRRVRNPTEKELGSSLLK